MNPQKSWGRKLRKDRRSSLLLRSCSLVNRIIKKRQMFLYKVKQLMSKTKLLGPEQTANMNSNCWKNSELLCNLPCSSPPFRIHHLEIPGKEYPLKLKPLSLIFSQKEATIHSYIHSFSTPQKP